MRQNNNDCKPQTVFTRLAGAQVTGPERYRIFQTITVIFTAFGSALGSFYSSEIKAGVIGGLISMLAGFILMKLLMGDVKNIFRRNIFERTLDSIISMAGAGIFSGILGGLFGYFLGGGFQLSFSVASTCFIAGVISTSLAGLTAMFWESFMKKRD